MNQAVLADVKVPSTGSAAPLVGFPPSDVLLEPVEARKGLFAELLNLTIDRSFSLVQGPQLAVPIVNDAQCAGEAQGDSPAGHLQGVLGEAYAGTDDRVDVDRKVGVLGQHHQLPVQNLEAFLGDIVRVDVVDADLQMLQAGPIELLDALDTEQITVGNQPCHHFSQPYPPHHGVQLGVQHRLPSADGDHGGAQSGQMVDPTHHILDGHRRRDLVELVAVGAGKVAAADGDEVGQHRMPGGKQGFGNHAPFPDTPVRRQECPANPCSVTHVHSFVPVLSAGRTEAERFSGVSRLRSSQGTNICKRIPGGQTKSTGWAPPRSNPPVPLQPLPPAFPPFAHSGCPGAE